MSNLEMNNNDEPKAYLTFSLGKEMFSVGVDYVKEILEIEEITEVPESYDYMRGILNLRGNILPVIDTRLKMKMPRVDDTIKSRIIVLEIVKGEKTLKFGAVVDRAWEVIVIEEESIQPPPSHENYARSHYISGIVEKDEKWIMIIDINELLGNSEVLQLSDLQEDAEIAQ